MLTNNYSVIRELGSGAAGIVSLVRRKKDGRLFAAKEVSCALLATRRGGMSVEQEQVRQGLMKEVAVMRSLPQHPSIVELEEVIDTRDGIIVIMEYVDGGNLQDVIYPNGVPGNRTARKLMNGGVSESVFSPKNDYGSDTWGDGAAAVFANAGFSYEEEEASRSMNAQPADPLPEDKICQWLLQLGNALKFLHQHGVVHRDIKLQNILLTSQGLVKIADFGVAENLITNGEVALAHTTVGTPMYMAPEVCEGIGYDTQSDLWSLGVVGYELCCRRPPFFGSNMLAIADAVSNVSVGRIDAAYTDELDCIVRGMMTKDPKRRPTADVVILQLKMKRQGKTASELASFARLDLKTLAVAPPRPVTASQSVASIMPSPLIAPHAAAAFGSRRPPVVAGPPGLPHPTSAAGAGPRVISQAERLSVYAEARKQAALNRQKFESALLMASATSNTQHQQSNSNEESDERLLELPATNAAHDADSPRAVQQGGSGGGSGAQLPYTSGLLAVKESFEEFGSASPKYGAHPARRGGQQQHQNEDDSSSIGGDPLRAPRSPGTNLVHVRGGRGSPSQSAIVPDMFKAEYEAEVARQRMVLDELFPDSPATTAPNTGRRGGQPPATASFGGAGSSSNHDAVSSGLEFQEQRFDSVIIRPHESTTTPELTLEQPSYKGPSSRPHPHPHPVGVNPGRERQHHNDFDEVTEGDVSTIVLGDKGGVVGYRRTQSPQRGAAGTGSSGQQLPPQHQQHRRPSPPLNGPRRGTSPRRASQGNASGGASVQQQQKSPARKTSPYAQRMTPPRQWVAGAGLSPAGPRSVSPSRRGSSAGDEGVSNASSALVPPQPAVWQEAYAPKSVGGTPARPAAGDNGTHQKQHQRQPSSSNRPDAINVGAAAHPASTSQHRSASPVELTTTAAAVNRPTPSTSVAADDLVPLASTTAPPGVVTNAVDGPQQLSTSTGSQRLPRRHVSCQNCLEGGAASVIASVYCEDCRVAFCASCALYIHRHAIFANHNVVALDLGASNSVSNGDAPSIATLNAIAVSFATLHGGSASPFSGAAAAGATDGQHAPSVLRARPALVEVRDVGCLANEEQRDKKADTGCCVVM